LFLWNSFILICKEVDYDMLNRMPQFMNDSALGKDTIALLQAMIRIDTTNPPGNEIACAKFLEEYWKKQQIPHTNTKILESEPGRASLIITIEGKDPTAPSYGFMSHLDVVPAEGKWSYPPFSGELVQMPHDQFIWGRGAQDIKNLGASNIIAAITMLKENHRPKGTIKIILCADEEQGGEKGLKWLIDNHFEDVKVDYVLNEGGGVKLPIKQDFVIQTGEKGIMWTKLKVSGVAGHGSTPANKEKFALTKLMKIVQQIQNYKPPVELGVEFHNLRTHISLPGIARWIFGRKLIIRPLSNFVSKISGQNLSQIVLPLIQDMITPTNFHTGIKENSISPEAEAILDIRTLPGHTREIVMKELATAVGPKWFKEIEFIPIQTQEATTSPIDTVLYKQIQSILQEIVPGANLVPFLSPGSTDSKYFREKGIISYGFSPILKDEDLSWAEMGALAHGIDERGSVTNLMVATEFAYRMMKKV
jgi:acetylornithine deacetylase/succinyl-diaminopimelate desuccinylase-like protein